MPPRNVSIIVITAFLSLACYFQVPRSSEARSIVRAMHIISDRYVKPVETRELYRHAMNGMVEKLDRYSNYIGPDDYSALQASLQQKFGGIGIMVDGPPRVERLRVVSPLVGTPAYRAGIQAGDVILSIDGTSTEGVTLEQAVVMMRGEKGTEVRLQVLHPGSTEPVEVAVRRDTIQTESVKGDTHREDDSWSFVLESNPHIGYVRITTFGDRTTGELSTALEQIRNRDVTGLILDLRGCPGGLLTTAVEACDLFLEQGRIVSTRERDQVRDVSDASRGTEFPLDLPMVVLIDRNSASAAEIVAACLKDQQRAAVCGQRSWGKGSVQNIIELDDGRSALKLTTATYFRPNGKNIHRAIRDYKEEDPEEWGVKPSEGLRVSMTDEQLAAVFQSRRNRDVVTNRTATPSSETPVQPGEEPVVDLQLQKALEFLREAVKTNPGKVRKA